MEINYSVTTEMYNFSLTMNTTSNNTGIPLTPGCKLYNFTIYTIVVGTLCVLGVIGNLVAFAIFQLDNLKTSTTFLFQGLSIMDTFLLITAFPLYCIQSLVVYLGGEHQSYMNVHAYLQVFIYPITMVFQTATIWVTVLVGINRYIAVCMPYQASRLCSVSKARQNLIAVIIISVLYNIPRFLGGKICHKDGKTEACPTSIGDNINFHIIYNNICYLIFMLALPVFILTALNIRLIKTLKAINRRRSEMQTRQQQQDNNVTFVLIIVVLVFTVCQFPALINQILWNTLPESSRDCGGFQFYYSKLSNMMVIVNSAVNIIIYLLFNKRFKSVMAKHCLFCKEDKCKEEKTRYGGTNGATQTLLTHV